MRPHVPVTIGGAVVVAGVYLPWFTSSLTSVSGLDLEGNDGLVALTAGGILAVLGLAAVTHGMRLAHRIITGLAAVVVLYVGVWNWSRADDLTDLSGGVISVGPGLPVITIGAAVALAGLLMREDEPKAIVDAGDLSAP